MAAPSMSEMDRLEQRFAQMFGNTAGKITAFPSLVSAEPADAHTHQAAEVTEDLSAEDSGSVEGSAEGSDAIEVYESHTKVVRDEFVRNKQMQKKAREAAISNANDRLIYMCGLWPDVTADPHFENTVRYMERLENRRRRWLKARGTRRTFTGKPTGPPFERGHIFRLLDQSAHHMVGGMYPDMTNSNLQGGAAECTADVLADEVQRSALLKWALLQLSDEQFAGYKAGVDAERVPMAENARHVANSTGSQRLADLNFKTVLINGAEKLRNTGATAGTGPADGDARAGTETLRTEDTFHSPMADVGLHRQVMRSRHSDPLGAPLDPFAKQLSKQLRKTPLITDDTTLAPLSFEYEYTADAHVSAREMLVALPLRAQTRTDDAALNDLVQALVAAEREYNRKPAARLEGQLLYAACTLPKVPRLASGVERAKGERESADGAAPEWGLPVYRVNEVPTWRANAAGIPVGARDAVIAIDEYAVRDDTQKTVHHASIYVAQAGALACYTVSDVLSAGDARVLPRWYVTGLPKIAQMAVCQGWVALTTVGNNLIVLRADVAAERCYAMQCRAPLTTAVAWEAPEYDSPGTQPKLWLGDALGYLCQMRVSLTSPPAASADQERRLQAEWGHRMWTNLLLPLRKVVARGQHVVSLTEFALVSQPVTHAFVGGLPYGAILMHGIMDVAFHGHVCAAIRPDGTVYLFDLLTRKLDTTLDQMAKDLKASKQSTPPTTNRMLYFNGDFLRAMVPSFAYMQSTIHPAPFK